MLRSAPQRLFAILVPVAAGVLALGLVLLLTAVSTSSQRALHGPWAAAMVLPDGRQEPVELNLPGTFVAQGIPGDALVRAWRDITLPPSRIPWAIHLEVPRHAAAVRWDGVEIARVGDPDDTGPNALGTSAPLLAILPADPDGGTHHLELIIRGDLGRGGLTGQIRAAPIDELVGALQAEVGMRLGFALAFTLVASLHLFGAVRRGPQLQRNMAQPFDVRWTELYFGMFTLSVAGYAFEHSTSSLAFGTDPAVHLLLRRVFVGGMIAFPVLFATHFLDDRTPPAAMVWSGVVGSTVLASFLGPPWASRMEGVQDLLVLVCALAMAYITVRAWNRRVAGRLWFVAAVFIATIGAIDEVLVTNGVIAGARGLYPCLSLFLLFGSLAVVQQDRELSARLRRLVTGSPDAMLELDANGRVLQLNPSARAFMPGLGLGDPFLELVPPNLLSRATAHLKRAGQGPSRLEFHLVDGRVVESVATPLDRTSRLVVLRDVTRRRRAEEDLVQAARLETAGTLLGGVAHDFNNLLGTLLGHIGLLRMTTQGDAVGRRLDRMEHTIERASLITRRLLAVGGRTDHNPTEVDVGPVLSDTADIVEPALPVGVVLSLHMHDEHLRVFASEEDLRHILLNLVLNARDAVIDRGTIRICASGDDDMVQIRVIDDGPGVPLELRHKIFEPFFTTKGPERGTGLGLPMARRLAGEQGGQLELGDEPTGGCFVLSLPRLKRPAPALAPVQHAVGARIAVVDDEEAQGALFSDALRRAGYAVVTFSDPYAALAELSAQAPAVLVTDVVMPGMSGLELASALRELHPHLPVLVVSGFVPTSERNLDGPTEHVDKPVRADRVVEAVGRLSASHAGERL